MANSAVSVANAFLLNGFKDKEPISPMMIQKLLYLAQGYHLYLCKLPVFDEDFQAWRFGPVVPSIYQACKKYSRHGITELLTEWYEEWEERVPAAPPSESEAIKVIEFVWENYGSFNPMRLSQWTHVKDGPWDRALKSGTRIRRHKPIPNMHIQEYFERALGDQSKSNAS